MRRKDQVEKSRRPSTAQDRWLRRASRLPARRVRLAKVLALWFFSSAAFAAVSAAESDPRAKVMQAIARAEQALSIGEPEIAESAFRDAQREGWMQLGRLHMAAGAAGDEAAEHSFRQALQASVIARDPTLSLALLAARRGEHEKSRSLLRGLIARDPRDGAARRMLAQTLVSDGQTEAAVQELEEGWAADPSNLETAFALATGYLRLEKLERAAELYSVVAEQRSIAETHVLIGRMYRDFGHYDEAISWLEGAIHKKAEVRRARYYLGTVTLLQVGMDGLEAAIDRFEAELELSPDDPMTYLYLGSAMVENRQLEPALELLERAAAWPPATFDAERYRGRALLALGRTEEAVDWLGRALARGQGANSRDLAELHYQLGTAKRRLVSQHESYRDEAAEHFALAKELGRELAAEQREKFSAFVRDDVGRSGGGRDDALVDPFDQDDGRFDVLADAQRRELDAGLRQLVARASMNLGVLEARSRRLERAVDHFERAAAADPQLADLDRSLGLAYFQTGRFDRAVEPLTRAAEKASGDLRLSLRRTLAVAHLNVTDYEATIILLKDDPERQTNQALQLTYAVALVRGGRAAEAAPIFDRLTASRDEWPALRAVLGQAKAQDGDFEGAEKELLRALELDPKIADARLSLGEIYLRLGRLGEAAEVLAGELDVRPGHHAARYLLATVLDLDRRPDDAEGHLRELLRKAPRHGDARYLLGKILLAGGDAASAVEQLRAAAEISPGDANVHYQLGQAYQRSGQGDIAKQHFETFRRLKAEQRGAS